MPSGCIRIGMQIDTGRTMKHFSRVTMRRFEIGTQFAYNGVVIRDCLFEEKMSIISRLRALRRATSG